MKFKYYHFLIIVIVCLAAYFQVAFLLDSLKWDSLDAYLPMRYFTSECLRHNFFPLWLPYQGIGCPVYADLISTNSPECLLLGRLIPYTNIVLHFVFVFYVIMAGIGIYKLAIYLKIKPEFALLLGIAYPLSGFFVGNAQHLQFLISGAWMPFVLLFWFRLMEKPIFKNLLLFVLFTYLLISGGYPAHTIVLAYFTAILFVVQAVKILIRKNYHQLIRVVIFNLAALILLGIMCFGMFISVKQSLPYIARYNGLNYDMSVICTFAPQCLISLISPLTPALHSAPFHTDLSMNNLYFGIIMFLFFIYGTITKTNFYSRLFLISGVIILLITFGPYFYLHKLAFIYLPFFDKFRYPANLRVFVILFFLLFTGIQLSNNSIFNEENKVQFRRVLILFLVLNVAILLLSAIMMIKKILGPVSFKFSLTSILNDYSIYGTLFLQTFINLLICLAFYLAVFHYKIKKPVLFITALVIGETILYAQFNAPLSVYYPNTSPRAIHSFLQNRPDGFPLPDNHIILENTDKSVSFESLWVNTNVYAKTVSSERVYPVVPNGLRILSKDSLLYHASLNHALLFLTDKVFELSARKLIFPKKDEVFVPDSIYNKYFINRQLKHSAGDTVRVTRLDPSGIEADVYCSNKQACILLQNNYKGWKAFINDKEVRHFTFNHTLIGVVVPAGYSKLHFEFTNPSYVIATLTSQCIFLLLIYLYLVFYLLKDREKRMRRAIVWILTSIPFILLIILLIYPRESYATSQKHDEDNLITELKKNISSDPNQLTTFIINDSRPEAIIREFQKYPCYYQRFRTTSDLINLKKNMDTLHTSQLIYIRHDVIEVPGIKDVIELKFSRIIKEIAGKNYKILIFSNEKGMASPVLFTTQNDFEKKYPHWTMNSSLLDSAVSYSGKYAYNITPDADFGATYRYTFETRPRKPIHVFTSMQFLCRKELNNCYIVISVNRKGKTLYYSAETIGRFFSQPDRWDIAFSAQTYWPGMLRQGDELIVYCWNNENTENLVIDDFLFKIE